MQRLARFALTSFLAVSAAGCDSGASSDLVYTLDEVARQPSPLVGWSALPLLYNYPEFASRAGIDGPVRTSVVVGRDGVSRDVEILSSPNELLSEHAVKTLRATVWESGEVSGEPVRVRGDVCVRYELEGSGSEAVGSAGFGWCGS